jgi:hypothetical protein
MVGRQEHRILGVQLHQGICIAPIGRCNVPSHRRLNRLAGIGIGGDDSPAAGGQCHEQYQGYCPQRCHFGVNLAIFRAYNLAVCIGRPSVNPQPGFLWHADLAIDPHFPSPVSAVLLAAPCSLTAIGSWPNMGRSVPTAEAKHRLRPSRSTTSGPAEGKRRTTVRTIWFWPAGSATQRRPIRPWSLFSCRSAPAVCSSCTTATIFRTR